MENTLILLQMDLLFLLENNNSIYLIKIDVTRIGGKYVFET
jgi:hypothetical protein